MPSLVQAENRFGDAETMTPRRRFGPVMTSPDFTAVPAGTASAIASAIATIAADTWRTEPQFLLPYATSLMCVARGEVRMPCEPLRIALFLLNRSREWSRLLRGHLFHVTI